MNSKENGLGMNGNKSYLDENCSHCSGDSLMESNIEEEQPIRVRDMINLYNFAQRKNQELAQAKTVYFGSLNSTQQSVDEMETQHLEQECCNGHYLTDNKPGGSLNSKPGSFRLTTSDDQTSMQQSLQGDGAGGESIEKSYQSKTTIRRTEQGVRIIIDIFFDKPDSDIDIIGSRVETDIPESRILADFQQHSLAMHSKKINQSPNV